MQLTVLHVKYHFKTTTLPHRPHPPPLYMSNFEVGCVVAFYFLQINAFKLNYSQPYICACCLSINELIIVSRFVLRALLLPMDYGVRHMNLLRAFGSGSGSAFELTM